MAMHILWNKVTVKYLQNMKLSATKVDSKYQDIRKSVFICISKFEIGIHLHSKFETA